MQGAPISIPAADPRERALARTLGLPDLVARVLLARGIDDPGEVRSLMRPDLRSLADPFTFGAMERAVGRIREAIRSGERIAILGDYDTDGISGTVLLLKLFALMSVDVGPHIPARSEGYSFNEGTLAAVRRSGATLAISVDNGTNAVEYTGRLQAEAGCDVIITDHHGTTENVADAYAVLNPRLHDAGYPDRDLAGVGVAFRLAAAVARSFSPDRALSPEFRTFLIDAMTYVALGTVADVAPLRGENRIMVHHGLRAMAASRNPGIRALLDAAGIVGRSPDAEDIAFRIAPLLNAAGRVGHAHDAVRLLMAPGYAEAQDAVKVLERCNLERRRIEQELMEEVLPRAEACDDPAIVLDGDGWHPGVLGIVAARLVDRFERPAVLIAFEDGVGRGSARSPAGRHLRNAFAECADRLTSYGGHAAAAGLELRREHLDAFRHELNEALTRQQPREDPLQVDGAARFEELAPRDLRRLEMLGPFGAGNPRPRFVTRDVRLVGHPTVHNRGQDLRLRVAREGIVLPARLAHGARHFEALREFDGPVTLAYSPRIGFRGEEGPIQLDVLDLAPERNGHR